jgi:hypothetical protein
MVSSVSCTKPVFSEFCLGDIICFMLLKIQLKKVLNVGMAIFGFDHATSRPLI